MVFSIFMQLCIYHHYLISEHHPKRNAYQLAVTPNLLSPSSVWQPLIYSVSLLFCLYWTFHVSGIKKHVVFCAWFLSLKYLQGSSMLQHISILHFFVGPNTVPLHGYIIFGLSIHQLMDIHVTYTWGLLSHEFFSFQILSK